MKTYEQFLASLHKTAWMQKDDFEAIQDEVLDSICKKLNHNTCDGWPECGSPICDYNQQLIKELSELKQRAAAQPNADLRQGVGSHASQPKEISK